MIIGIIGKKNSGKTTVASMINDLLNGTTCCINFADSLKREVAKACDVTVPYVEKNKTIFRPILQWWGTDFRRRLFGESYWVVQLDQAILHENSDNFIIADVRFQNEADYIKKMNGVLVRVHRSGEDNQDNHQSEREMDSIKQDHTILNARDLDFLRNEVKLLVAILAPKID